ncbi:amidohydrolase family protein [Nonomuraea sp. NPDC001636]|uniref:amidohydrolase family protein n=1 Tax=Nonomuraea sp. NPDC001636 TaxID=3154391 RepID=UPI0033303B74
MAHSAPLVLPICAEPVRDGTVVIRGGRVLQVGSRAELLSRFRVAEEVRWPGMIVAGLVDACCAPTAPGPGVTTRAAVVADPADLAGVPGVSYVEASSAGEQEWEDHDRDALITALREVDRPCPVGIAARTRDPHVLEDVAVLARTFGLRLLAGLDRHSPMALDEAGALGPHCHVACARPLDPGERKLLRLRRSVVAICPPGQEQAADVLALLEEGNRLALGSHALDDHAPDSPDPAGAGPGDLLGLAAGVRRRARELGLRVRGLDRRLVEAATLGGARALGLDAGPGRIGSLGPGSRADFAVFDARGRYPYSALLARPPCLATVVGGAVTGTGRPPRRADP